MHPDHKYILALLNNDRTLVKELYTKSFTKIKYMVLKNGGTEADAADVMQDALLSIYNRAVAHSFELSCPMDAFLYQVCRNKWISEIRRRHSSPQVSFTDTERYTNISQDSFEEAAKCLRDHEQKKLFEEKFSELGEACKELLKLNWSGKQLEEVASLLHFTYAYARKKKSECMAKLMTLIQQSPVYENLKIK